MTAARDIEPFFFGGEEAPLFGCFHPARRTAAKGHAALLCAPAFQEYILSHRSLKRLAVLLSRAGYPALRFDYRGCGDSSGELEDCRLGDWAADVGRAAAELTRRSGCRSIVILGMRLGGSLAAVASPGLEAADRIVLWDPVVHGPSYLEDLAGLQRATLAGLRRDGPAVTVEGLDEVSGFPLSPPLKQDLRGLDLSAAGAGRPGRRVLLLQTQEDGPLEELARRLEAGGAGVDHRREPGPRVWEADINRVLAPAEVLRTIVGWVKEVCP